MLDESLIAAKDWVTTLQEQEAYRPWVVGPNLPEVERMWREFNEVPKRESIN